MAIPDGYRANLEMIQKAAVNGDLGLMECEDRETGKTVIALIAIDFVDNEYLTVPLAKMFDGNPYEELRSAMEIGERDNLFE